MCLPYSDSVASPLLLFGVLPVLLFGCGAESESGTPPAAAGSPDITARLERSALTAILPAGPSWLLRRVSLEPALDGAEFVGWRLAAVPEEWTELDLRAGDVVTRVNGMAIETPTQASEVWTSLATATELRVTYERGGKSKQLVLPIEGVSP